jgi:hypothetical protein
LEQLDTYELGQPRVSTSGKRPRSSSSLMHQNEHPVGIVWRALAEAELVGGWLMPNDFKLALRHGFTLGTAPMPAAIAHSRSVCVTASPAKPRYGKSANSKRVPTGQVDWPVSATGPTSSPGDSKWSVWRNPAMSRCSIASRRSGKRG